MSHKQQCALVAAGGGAGTSYSTTYGINHTSALNKLKHFDPIHSFPFDIMHVLFEGVVPLELSLLLASLIDDKKLLHITDLNNRLTTHPYGYSEVDTKPTPIERESPGVYKIRQSGVSVLVIH